MSAPRRAAANSPARPFALSAARPVQPHYWLIENYRRAHTPPDLLKRKDALVLGIMAAAERRLQTTGHETLTALLAQVVGPANLRHLRLDALPTGKTKSAHKGTLFLQCTSPVHAFEFRRYLTALQTALKPHGITRVVLR